MGDDEALGAVGDRDLVAELGRPGGLAPADGPGVGIGERDHPIRDGALAGKSDGRLVDQPADPLELPRQAPDLGPAPAPGAQGTPGVPEHAAHVLVGAAGQLVQLAGQAVDRLPAPAPAEGVRDPAHPDPGRATAIANAGAGGEPRPLDPVHRRFRRLTAWAHRPESVG